MLSKNEMISLGEIERIVAGQHHDPHSVLGAHANGDGVTIRALRPLATEVTAVLPDGSRYPMLHRHQGVFEVTVPESAGPVREYELEVRYVNGEPQRQDDLGFLLDQMGMDDHILFSSDYPHWDFDAPDRAIPPSLNPQLRDAILCTNAHGIYRLGDTPVSSRA